MHLFMHGHYFFADNSDTIAECHHKISLKTTNVERIFAFPLNAEYVTIRKRKKAAEPPKKRE